LPLERSETLVADPSGGTTPVLRTSANTELITSKAAQVSSVTGDASSLAKVFGVNFGSDLTFGGYDISDYYEGDIALVRLELDDDGAGLSNIGILSVEISGKMWKLGDEA